MVEHAAGYACGVLAHSWEPGTTCRLHRGKLVAVRYDVMRCNVVHVGELGSRTQRTATLPRTLLIISKFPRREGARHAHVAFEDARLCRCALAPGRSWAVHKCLLRLTVDWSESLAWYRKGGAPLLRELSSSAACMVKELGCRWPGQSLSRPF